MLLWYKFLSRNDFGLMKMIIIGIFVGRFLEIGVSKLLF